MRFHGVSDVSMVVDCASPRGVQRVHGSGFRVYKGGAASQQQWILRLPRECDVFIVVDSVSPKGVRRFYGGGFIASKRSAAFLRQWDVCVSIMGCSVSTAVDYACPGGGAGLLR